MNWLMILLAGLLAGATTCAVTQGGLLVGLITRQRAAAGLGATRGTLADDLAPVGGFLAGKLISHTAAGAVLGAAGAALGFNAKVGAVALLVAGAIMVVLGLGSLGVPGFRNVTFTPPQGWLKVVKKQTRSGSAQAPFLLGLAVILVPCGVTLSMLVLAASSGSALVGAAVMAVFVIGTAPAFTVYGFLGRKLAGGPVLAKVLGALVVLFGVLTFNSGLVAGGSPVALPLPQPNLAAAAPASSGTPAAPAASGTQAAGQAQEVVVRAENGGYSPGVVTASAGSPIRITFTTQNVHSCILATTLPTLDQAVILPDTGSKTLDLGALRPGDYPISCSMGMYTATLRVTA